MIARDEERCIRRALASAAPFVDEMVVLDTGSRDATIAIAQAAGARVASATWQDDFSIARNAALAMTDCDYILMLDADEWVTAGGERLRGWCRSADQLGAIEIVSSFTDDGEVRHSTSRVVRLVARGVRFIGAVHEQPDRGWPARDTGLRVEHDGYQTAQSERKRGRNERLLRAELAHAEDGYLRSQLGVDLEVQGRYAEAADAYDRALALTDPGSRWRHPLVARSLHVLARAGLYDRALALFAVESERWPDSPDVFFAGGNLLWSVAVDRREKAHMLVPMALRCWRRCLEIGERPDLEGTVHGRGSDHARRNLEQVEAALAESPGLR